MDLMKVVSARGVCATLVLLSLALTSLYTVRPELLQPKLATANPNSLIVNPKHDMTNLNLSVPDLATINSKFAMVNPSVPTVNPNLAGVTSKESADDCIHSPFVSFRPEGRLGNRVCEYIHLFHFHVRNSINAGVHPEMWESIHAMFPQISLKTLTPECLKRLSRHEFVYKTFTTSLTNSGSQQVMLIGTPCKPTIFWDARDQWRRELVFAPNLQSNATYRTSLLLEKWQQHHHHQQQQQQQGTEDTTESSTPPTLAPASAPAVVGVHVRRGDYQELLDRYSNDGLLSAVYYHRAFKHYRQRLDRPVFLVLTEPSERDWCRKQLARGTDDVIVVDDSASAEQDLALLASTKHIIYSHGTFGLMGILLSDANTVVYPAVSADKKKKRYALHNNLDILSKNYSSIDFVTISSDENEYVSS